VTSATKSMKVLHVGPHFEDRGGIASVLASLRDCSELLRDFGFDLLFLATTRKGLTGHVRKAIFFFQATLSLVELLRRDRIEIVHIHTATRGSPRNTFRNCGSSSRLVRRKNPPTRVTRESLRDA
jgi:hypothetical protein